MKLRMMLGLALAGAAFAILAAPASALAAGPVTTPQVIFTEGFEGALPARLWLDWVAPDPGNPAPAFWGRVTARRHSGTYGLWCAGSIPNKAPDTGWASFAGKYPDYTEGIANFSVPELADYYSATLDYWYDMPSIGAADGDSFNVMWQPATGGIWDTHIGQPIVSSFTHVTDSLTFPTLSGQTRPIDLSRTAGTLRFNFIDNSGDVNETPTNGEGPTIDDVTVAGFKYGPVRNLAATVLPGNTAVQVTWATPVRSTVLLAGPEERPIAYRVWRTPDVQPYVWTELTGSRIAETTFTDAAPLDGGARYIVQAWDPLDGPGYGEVNLNATALAYVAPPVPVTSISITGGAPNGSGTYTALPTITLSRDTAKGTTSYSWDGGQVITSSAQTILVPALNGIHSLDYFSSSSLGTPETHHAQTVTVSIPDAGPAPVTTVTIIGTKDSSGAYISPTVRVTRDQPGGITYYSLDGASASTTTATFTLAVGPGSHAVAAYSVSANGVQEAVKVPFAFNVKSRPSVGTPSLSTSRPRHGRYFYIRGSLGPAHTATTTLRLYVERYSSGRYRSYRTYTVTLGARATSYSYRVTLTATGTYRVRAYHADTLHSATYSGYRGFKVY